QVSESGDTMEHSALAPRQPGASAAYGLEDETQRVLHFAPAVGGRLRGGAAEQGVAYRHVRIRPHERVRQVVSFEPELELILLLDREDLGERGVRVPEDRPRDAAELIRIHARSERRLDAESVGVEPLPRAGIVDVRISDHVGIAEAQELARAIRVDAAHLP